MNNNHVKTLRLKNFKRFTDLEIADLGLINLIVGDNNVGKTSVLEALIVPDVLAKNIGELKGIAGRYTSELHYILEHYKKLDNYKGTVLKNYTNLQGKGGNFEIGLEYPDNSIFVLDVVSRNESNRDWLLTFKYPNKEKGSVNLNDLTLIHYQSPSFYYPFFIPYFLGYNHDLTNFYSEHIQKDSLLKKEFIKSLQVILPDLTDIVVDTVTAVKPILLIEREGYRFNTPLATFGDGLTNLFRLLIEIYRNEGKRIMIDEIDYGIHFARKSDFWKSILHAAKINQVQIFATTHNNECIQALQESGTEEDEIRIVRLAEVKEKQIKAYTYNYKEFTHSLQHEIELR